jgi:hypothetical protein
MHIGHHTRFSGTSGAKSKLGYCILGSHQKKNDKSFKRHQNLVSILLQKVRGNGSENNTWSSLGDFQVFAWPTNSLSIASAI